MALSKRVCALVVGATALVDCASNVAERPPPAPTAGATSATPAAPAAPMPTPTALTSPAPLVKFTDPCQVATAFTDAAIARADAEVQAVLLKLSCSGHR